jgi:hypothetical protein
MINGRRFTLEHNIGEFRRNLIRHGVNNSLTAPHLLIRAQTQIMLVGGALGQDISVTAMSARGSLEQTNFSGETEYDNLVVHTVKYQNRQRLCEDSNIDRGNELCLRPCFTIPGTAPGMQPHAYKGTVLKFGSSRE